MKRIQRQAIEHYDRMIAWAETMPATDTKDAYKMRDELRECAGPQWCSYCTKYRTEDDCGICPLSGKYSTGAECCNRLHEHMTRSKTWKQWIERAKKVREYIRENG